MVKFQILDRRRFEPFITSTSGEVRYTGPVPPPPRAGWKDTVRAEPRVVTRIIVRFEGLRAAMCGIATCWSTKTTR